MKYFRRLLAAAIVLTGLTSQAEALCVPLTAAADAPQGIKDDLAELVKPLPPVAAGDEFDVLAELEGPSFHLPSLRLCSAILGLAGDKDAKTGLARDLKQVASTREKALVKSSPYDIGFLAEIYVELGAALASTGDKAGAAKAYAATLKLTRMAQDLASKLEKKAVLPKPDRYDEVKNRKEDQKFDATVMWPVIQYDDSLRYLELARKFRSQMKFLEGRTEFGLGAEEKGKALVVAALELDPDNQAASRFMGDFLQPEGEPIALPFGLTQMPSLERVAISPDGERIATIARFEHVVRVWDWRRGKLLYTGMPPGEAIKRDDVEGFAFAGSSTRLAVVEDTPTDTVYFRVWDIEDPSFHHESYFAITGGIVTSRDGELFGAYGWPIEKDAKLPDTLPNNAIELFELPDLDHPRRIVAVDKDDLKEVTFQWAKVTPDGRSFGIVGNWYDHIGVGDISTGRIKYYVKIEEHGGVGSSFELSDGGKYLAYDFSDRNKIGFFDVKKNKPMGTTPQMKEIWGHAFFDKGERLLTWGDDGLAIWTTKTAKKETQLPNFDQSISDVQISPDETFLAGAGRNGCATIWSLTQRKLLVSLCARNTTSGAPASAVILPSGEYFADSLGEALIEPAAGSSQAQLKKLLRGTELVEPLSPD